jgi:hypothetical protein
MAPEGSPLLALAQQGAEAANHVIVAERSTSNHQEEPSIGNWLDGWAKRAWSEAASSASSNCLLAYNDACPLITHNHWQREYDYDHDDLCNVIDDRKRLRARSPTPPWCSPARDVTPSGRDGFHDLATPLRQVVWPEKFKAVYIDKYDGSSNLDEFIQVYHMIIEAVGGDDRVKANYLPMTLSGATRSWLINLPEGSIYTWDQLCTMFIINFQGTYECPSIAETLKTIRQKHDESLWDFVKRFYNARNTIPYIQDIEIINAFRDGVSDIKTIEEITIKKPKTVVNLLTIANVCIKVFEAWPRLLESLGKGPLKKK